MNKKFITAMIFTFIAVKNPVNLVSVETAHAAPAESPRMVNAVSEADIATNIEISVINKKILSNEEIASLQLAEHKTAVEAEIAAEKAATEARIIAENADRIAKLQAAGLSTAFIANYVQAEDKYHVPWQVIAAVHRVETHQSGDTVIKSYAGAQGPMQFMPSTFRAYAQDGDGDGVTNIGDVDDAIFTAANYMAANGASIGNVSAALYRYNHSTTYVNHVLSIARSLGFAG